MRPAHGQLATLAASLLLSCIAFGARAEIDLAELTRETQRQAQVDDATQFVQWVPADVWDVAMRQQGTPDDVRESKLAQMVPYLVFLVGEVRIGPAGGIGYATATELASRASLVLAEPEDARRPLETEGLPDALRDFLASVVPAATSAANLQLHALVFDGRSRSGAPLADPRAAGRLTLALGDRRHVWRLPLGALMGAKTCPVDGETFPGNFRFCPFHGESLEEGAPSARGS